MDSSLFESVKDKLENGRVEVSDTGTSIDDGWRNTLSGLNDRDLDKGRQNRPYYNLLNSFELDILYASSALSSRIVDSVASDATREWIEEEPEEFRELRVKEKFEKALKSARLYGGSILYLDIDDGRDPSQPLNTNNIKSLDGLVVLERPHLNVSHVISSPLSDKDGQPERYMVNSYTGIPSTVHHSRVLVFEGEDTPTRVKRENGHWALSSLQRPYDELKNYEVSLEHVGNILEEFVISVYGLENLGELVSENNSQAIFNRMAVMNATKSNLRSVFIDSQETFDKHTTNLSGLSDTITKLQEALSAATGIPGSILFGTPPQGMNATGFSELSTYYNNIHSIQQDRLAPKLKDISSLLNITDFNPVFKPLWSKTEQEVAETTASKVDTLLKLVEAGYSREEAEEIVGLYEK